MALDKTHWIRCVRCGGTGSLKPHDVGQSAIGDDKAAVECELCNGSGMVATATVRPGIAAVCLMTMFVIGIITYFSPEVGAATVLLLLALGFWAMVMSRRI